MPADHDGDRGGKRSLDLIFAVRAIVRKHMTENLRRIQRLESA
jgi:hypothetical protein